MEITLGACWEEAGWAPEPVWTLWIGEIFLVSVEIRSADRSGCSVVSILTVIHIQSVRSQICIYIHILHNIERLAGQKQKLGQQRIPRAKENLPRAKENLTRAKESLPPAKENLPRAKENLPRAKENLTRAMENLTRAKENLTRAKG